jgi:TolB-like protein
MCIGLLDTVTAKLAELRRFRKSLSVVPASEVRTGYVSSVDMAHSIFGVDLVVTGSVLRESDLVRIPVQLVDAVTIRQLQSRTITTERTADFILQDRVVETIEEMLDLELGAEERQAMRVGGTSSAEAAELFLEARGRTPTAAPSEDQLTLAMGLYRQALELDPNYAEAMIQLADSCRQRFELTKDPIWLEHGSDYARRAIDVAPDLPAAHFAAGRLALDVASYPVAMEHLQRTITLDPLNISAYVYLSDAHVASGDSEQAEETLERAVLRARRVGARRGLLPPCHRAAAGLEHRLHLARWLPPLPRRPGGGARKPDAGGGGGCQRLGTLQPRDPRVLGG